VVRVKSRDRPLRALATQPKPPLIIVGELRGTAPEDLQAALETLTNFHQPTLPDQAHDSVPAPLSTTTYHCSPVRVLRNGCPHQQPSAPQSPPSSLSHPQESLPAKDGRQMDRGAWAATPANAGRTHTQTRPNGATARSCFSRTRSRCSLVRIYPHFWFSPASVCCSTVCPVPS
jgi:hypothetical protein